MTDTAALIGIGAMGKALLARLRQAGKPVRAFDVAEPGRDAARAAGAAIAASAAEAARGAEQIHVFVRTDAEMIDAVLGTDGVLAGAEPGALLFLHSTVLPATTRRIAAASAARQVRALDAPVTSVPARVAAGEAVFLVGGADDVVAAARPHLLALGREVHHFGPLGAGNVAKLAKNLANAAERVLMDEVLRVVEAGGLDPRAYLDMCRAVDQGSLVSRWERSFTVENGHAVHRPASNLFNKDMKLAADYAASQGLDVPMTQSAAATGLKWSAEWERQRKGATAR
jgi:3-hydroxyisobutyrate dehydrogenase-like beta-hydroxyacid dehydrogenase